MPNSGLSNEDRFWDRVDVRSPGDCWLWKMAPCIHGYGCFRLKGVRRDVRPSRFSWMLCYGPIPSGLNVLHRCDTPLCCNPLDLFLGTQRDNIHDMMEKGRWGGAVGDAHPKAVLTACLVREIRRRIKDGESLTHLALEYGIAPSTLHSAKSGITWKHVL